jgi:PTS system nitrogen regulatory IIA component
MDEQVIPDRMLTLTEVGALLNVSPKTVARELERGNLPGRKIGRQWRCSERAIHEWMRGKDAN